MVVARQTTPVPAVNTGNVDAFEAGLGGVDLTLIGALTAVAIGTGVASKSKDDDSGSAKALPPGIKSSREVALGVFGRKPASSASKKNAEWLEQCKTEVVSWYDFGVRL